MAGGDVKHELDSFDRALALRKRAKRAKFELFIRKSNRFLRATAKAVLAPKFKSRLPRVFPAFFSDYFIN